MRKLIVTMVSVCLVVVGLMFTGCSSEPETLIPKDKVLYCVKKKGTRTDAMWYVVKEENVGLKLIYLATSLNSRNVHMQPAKFYYKTDCEW